jgi:RluA family pseudouridine synthase
MSVTIAIPDHILFEDPYILVLHKPHGLMVEPDRNGYPNLLQHVKQYLKSFAAAGEEVYAQHIHRLDRPVSGVILFAKQKSVLKNLSEQFAQRTVKKHYQALTSVAPQQRDGILEHWHRKEKKKAALYLEPIAYTEKAALRYRVEQIAEQQFLWYIELYTGKYHQIRAQLASIDCPIVGDALYGSTVPYQENAIALHAHRLVFQHPMSGEEMIVEKKLLL